MKQEAINKLYKECSEIITEETQEIHQLILGDGNPNANVVFLVDAPGAKEEESGEVISGKSRDKLYELFDAISVKREEVYITNMVKYRPYKINAKTGRILNRSLREDEINFFIPYLKREIDIIKPKIVVTLGMNVVKGLLAKNVDLKDEHGIESRLTILDNEYIIFPMYHPLAMVYSSEEPNEDLVKLKGLIEQINKVTDEEERAAKEVELNNETEPIKKRSERAYKIFDTIEKQELTTSSDDKSIEQVVETIENGIAEVKALTDRDEKNTAYKEGSSQIKESSLRTFYDGKKYRKASTGKNGFSSGAKMRTLVVYAGGTDADDPTHVVVDRIGSVLTELNGSIIWYDLNKRDVDINDFFSELENANSVLLATTVEWIGVGGLLQQFLDECWRFSNKAFFTDVFLMSVVISKQGYERDAYNHLIKSWELLGGIEGVSVCASMKSSVELDTNFQLLHTIEKRAEEFYRLTTTNKMPFPTSIRQNRTIMKVPQLVEFYHYGQEDIPIQTNSMSYDTNKNDIKNYDEFIERQQQDIEDISNLFKKKLQKKSSDATKTEPDLIREKFKKNSENIETKIQWDIVDKRSKDMVIELKADHIKAYFGNISDANMKLSSEYDVVKKIIEGAVTIQRAFMTGQLKAKGDFSLIYKLDKIFDF